MAFPVFRSVALVALITLAACTDGPRQDHVARNGLHIFDRGDGRFEVIAQAGTAGPNYFCAAGDYARVRLNARATDQVVLVGPDGPSSTLPGRRSAVFQVTPSGGDTAFDVSTASMRRAGASMSVALAQSLCEADMLRIRNRN